MEAPLVRLYRYADLVKMGVVEKFSRPTEKVLALVICPSMPSAGIHDASFWIGADNDPLLNNQEEEADAFAADMLIPKDAYPAFRAGNCTDDEAIQRFADRLGIAAGIVVGRLQRDGLLDNSWMNHLRERFEWQQEVEKGANGRVQGFRSRSLSP